MQSSRAQQIFGSLFEGDRGERTLPELLCHACLDSLPVTGAGIALMTDGGHQGVIAATDGPAWLMEDLQHTLGEGPCLDASSASRPVLEPDFAKTGPDRWPAFGPAVLEAGVKAIFALPLQVGAVRLGVLDLYRDSVGMLNDTELSEALAFADAANLVLLHLQDRVEPGQGMHPQLVDPLGWQPEVHQSTGIIAVQSAVTLAEALLLLRARAFSDGRPIRGNFVCAGRWQLISGGQKFMDREQLLARTFVELTDTLVDEFDALDVMHTLTDRAVELLRADAAGIILTDQQGQMQVVASTSHEVHVVELFALQNDEGPCLDCFNSAAAIVNVSNGEAGRRWPRFVSAASAAGFRSAHALPLHLRGQTIGAMSLFCATETTLSEADLALGQALADVATISLLQERAIHQGELLAEQLQHALYSRIFIEQAKGSLAERSGIGVEQAFKIMRDYSRRTGQPLRLVAKGVLEGTVDTDRLVNDTA